MEGLPTRAVNIVYVRLIYVMSIAYLQDLTKIILAFASDGGSISARMTLIKIMLEKQMFYS
jgi:hypothetical protein